MSNRYSRQVLFSPIGKEGQDKIGSKHVLIIGAGALGSANAEMLTRAGVGKLTIVDRDYVEESNLQRQQLYTESDVEQKLPKAAAAEKRLKEINSDVAIESFIGDANPEKLAQLAQGKDLIIDSTDNFETRLAINDISQKMNIPWIYGACVGSYGMSFTIIPGVTPCLNCLLKAMPLQGMTCDTVGIISPAVGMVVAHQTAETLKILVEDWEAVRTSFVSFDLWRNQYSNMKMTKAKDESCLSCGTNRTYPFLEMDNLTKSTVLCGRDTVQVRPPKPLDIQLDELSKQLNAIGYRVKGNPYLLSIETGHERMVIFKDGRALVHGTKDMMAAKALYNRILG
ncbi:thiazole biosynthesis adenylyltransferase ThiF [Bacillus sp. V3B]|uniref:thiazole biosynthesis adenylyltransferase ThiF n=1 Tax=Bacillus sp. V3B TaxID=2804915 RepID=UPI00210EA4BE|nr:thiazole biosynthesis adenylyltransferase ThiF [Bacillus sp. V3B]MCQ6274542.1 thiazole biosynthesis adenylyltransferase ThiF [Bacillus sp. V3B]